MKKSIIVLWICLLSIQGSLAQERLEVKQRLMVKINPLPMIDHNPRLRVGMEYISDKKLGYSIDFGMGNNFLNHWRLNGLVWGQDYSFFEVRPEIKYLFKNTQKSYTYAALEFFFINMRDVLESGSYQKANSRIETTFDRATFNKEKYGLHLKGDINYIVSNRLNIDLYGGIGFAKRDFSYTNVVNPVDRPTTIFVEWIPKDYLFAGESTFFHTTLGMKIGYTIFVK